MTNCVWMCVEAGNNKQRRFWLDWCVRVVMRSPQVFLMLHLHMSVSWVSRFSFAFGRSLFLSQSQTLTVDLIGWKPERSAASLSHWAGCFEAKRTNQNSVRSGWRQKGIRFAVLCFFVFVCLRRQPEITIFLPGFTLCCCFFYPYACCYSDFVVVTDTRVQL